MPFAFKTSYIYFSPILKNMLSLNLGKYYVLSHAFMNFLDFDNI
jgi:hypothetical protein